MVQSTETKGYETSIPSQFASVWVIGLSKTTSVVSSEGSDEHLDQTTDSCIIINTFNRRR